MFFQPPRWSDSRDEQMTLMQVMRQFFFLMHGADDVSSVPLKLKNIDPRAGCCLIGSGAWSDLIFF